MSSSERQHRTLVMWAWIGGVIATVLVLIGVLFWSLPVVIGLLGNCPDCDISLGVPPETVGPNSAPVEWVGGPLQRQVRLIVPPGGLDHAQDGHFHIGITTLSGEPFSDVEFMIGSPINDRVVVEQFGGFQGWDWDIPLPDDCEQGCQIVIPVTIEQIEEGDPPRFSWSVRFDFGFGSGSSRPAAATEMRARIEPASEE